MSIIRDLFCGLPIFFLGIGLSVLFLLGSGLVTMARNKDLGWFIVVTLMLVGAVTNWLQNTTPTIILGVGLYIASVGLAFYYLSRQSREDKH